VIHGRDTRATFQSVPLPANLVVEFIIFKWHRLQSVIPGLVDHQPGKKSQTKVCATWFFGGGFAMKPLLLFILLFSPLSLMRSPECVCIKDPHPSAEKIKAERRQAFNKATAVFTGEVVAHDGYKVTFRLEKRWKGDASLSEVVLSTGAVRLYDGSLLSKECSYHFDLGEEYLVYAYGAAEKLEADGCLTQPIKSAAAEENGLDQIKPHETIRPREIP
jgi:hypothetical protein